jgi:hypothetical protein
MSSRHILRALLCIPASASRHPAAAHVERASKLLTQTGCSDRLCVKDTMCNLLLTFFAVHLVLATAFVHTNVRIPLLRLDATIDRRSGKWSQTGYADTHKHTHNTPRQLQHMGELPKKDGPKEDAEYKMNVGKALDTLRREMPIVFYKSSVDMSIFATYVTLIDTNRNKITVQKNIYGGMVSALRVVSAFSTVHPSLDVRKIEYIEDCRTIQCLVDVTLPESLQIEGRSSWEGIFYFGLNREGLIDTHLFDNKIWTYKSPPVKVKSSWAQASTAWNPVPEGGRAAVPEGGRAEGAHCHCPIPLSHRHRHRCGCDSDGDS